MTDSENLCYGENTYYCDFRAANGASILTREPVNFMSEPTEIVTINGMGFKKFYEEGRKVVYVRVSFANLSLVVAKNNEE